MGNEEDQFLTEKREPVEGEVNGALKAKIKRFAYELMRDPEEEGFRSSEFNMCMSSLGWNKRSSTPESDDEIKKKFTLLAPYMLANSSLEYASVILAVYGVLKDAFIEGLCEAYKERTEHQIFQRLRKMFLACYEDARGIIEGFEEGSQPWKEVSEGIVRKYTDDYGKTVWGYRFGSKEFFEKLGYVIYCGERHYSKYTRAKVEISAESGAAIIVNEKYRKVYNLDEFPVTGRTKLTDVTEEYGYKDFFIPGSEPGWGNPDY